MGRVPTISINKTEGCHLYLSEDALDCEIVSAKSSEMNVLVPQDDDYVSTSQKPAQKRLCGVFMLAFLERCPSAAISGASFEDNVTGRQGREPK
jgi:hypothetical protein